MASQSEAVFEYFRCNACLGLAPAEDLRDKVSKQVVKTLALDAEGSLVFPLNLLDHSDESIKARLQSLPCMGPVILASDATGAIPVLSTICGHIVGGAHPQAWIKVGSLSYDQLRDVPLGSQINAFVVIPTNGGSPIVVGAYVGASNAKEVLELNMRYVRIAEESDVKLRGKASDGLKSETQTLRALTMEGYNDLQKILDGKLPREILHERIVGFLDTDHYHKTILSQCQYGGSAMPFIRGTNMVADFTLLRLTSLPMEAFRRVDFASTRLPIAIADAKYMSELLAKIDEGLVPRDRVRALVVWLWSMRAIHYAVWCRDDTFSKIRRAELLFLGTALLLDFEVPDSFVEASVLHCFGQLFSLMFHYDIEDPKKTGSIMVEILWALTKTMHRGNHKVRWQIMEGYFQPPNWSFLQTIKTIEHH